MLAESAFTLSNIFAGTAGSLIAAALIFWWGRVFERKAARQTYVRKVESAPNTYVRRITSMIRRALTSPNNDAEIHARAIVDVRNAMRRSMTSIGENRLRIAKCCHSLREESIQELFLRGHVAGLRLH